jgi:plasmid stabilization system protein ParE
MRVLWTSKALSDLVRLHEFLAAVNKPAAARVIKSLTAAPAGLAANPAHRREAGRVRAG